VKYLLMSLVLVSGMTIPVQIAANKRMSEAMRSPVLAVACVAAVALGALLLVNLFTAGRRGELAGAAQAPWWVWTAGLLLAFAVTIQVINAAHTGAGPIIALIIAGQLMAAMVIDHFGWLNMEQNPIRWWKLLGAVLMAGGAWLLQIKAD
jgi:transporter family-2 protein